MNIKSNKAKFLFVVIIIFLLNSDILSSQTSGKDTLVKQNTFEVNQVVDSIDTIIPGEIDNNKIPGGIVTIVFQDSIVYNKGFGFSDLEDKKRVDPNNTIFRVASLSKIITTIAVLQLVEQGVLDLDENIEKYLTGVKINNPFEKKVTLRHLLTHTAGFDERNVGRRALKSIDVPPLQDYLIKRLPPVIREPGEVVSYSNYGTALAGFIVENNSGLSYEDYVEQRIFNPLGMSNSFFIKKIEIEDRIAKGYDLEGNPVSFEYLKTPPASMWMTTGQDAGKLMLMLINLGSLNEIEVLNKESVSGMLKTNFRNHPLLDGRSIGFSSYDTNPKLIYHNGNFLGFNSAMYIYLEIELGIFFSFNSNRGFNAMSNTMRKVHDSIFHLKNDPPDFVDLKFDNQDIEMFKGRYQHVRNTFTTIEKIENFPASGIKVRIKDKQHVTLNGRENYKQIGATTFLGEDGEFIAFKVGNNKKPDYMFIGENAYKRLLWYERANVQVLSLLTILLSCILILTGTIIRKVKAKKASSTALKQFRKVTILTSILVLVFFVALIIGFMTLSTKYEFPIIIKLMMILPHLSVILSLLIPWFGYKVVMDKHSSTSLKIWASLLSLIFLYHIWFLYFWNILFYKI